MWWAWLLAAIAIAGIVVWAVLASGDGEDVLVIVQQPAQVQVEEGDTVRVTGTVRNFEFDEAFGEEGEFVDFEDANAIVATSVEQIGGDTPQAGGRTSLEEIAGDDERVGEQVTVVGEVEEDDVGVASFTIEELDG